MLKGIIKFWFGLFIFLIGRHRWFWKKNQLLILTYHRVISPQDESIKYEQPGMYVKPETLALHIKTLRAQGFEIMHLSTWLEKRNSNQALPAKACALTFDDGWLDNFDNALPVLKKHNCPATLFVVSRYVDKTIDFWPGRLSRLCLHISMTQKSLWNEPCTKDLRELFPTDQDFEQISVENLDTAINKAKRYSDKHLNELVSNIEQHCYVAVPQQRVMLNGQEVEEMIASGLVDIGSHTCNHIRLKEGLSEDTLRTEILVSREEIENRYQVNANIFCYPNGDYCAESLAEVKKTYGAACTTQAGWNSTKSGLHELKRYNMHDSASNTAMKFLARIGSI